MYAPTIQKGNGEEKEMSVVFKIMMPKDLASSPMKGEIIEAESEEV